MLSVPILQDAPDSIITRGGNACHRGAPGCVAASTDRASDTDVSDAVHHWSGADGTIGPNTRDLRPFSPVWAISGRTAA